MLVVAPIVACSRDDRSIVVGDGDADAATDAANDGSSSLGCPASGPNPDIAEIAGPRGPMRVTRTEITRCQYAAFVSEIGERGGGPGYLCAWNDAYEPDLACMAAPNVYHGDGAVRHPQPCVDWCDAQAYCTWIGMHLCRGFDPGYGFLDFADATRSEWMSACSSAGAHPFPYGEAYDPERCNGACAGKACATREVGALAGCEAPGHVLDLSGNVAEWEDVCDGATDAHDACRLRGGSFTSEEPGLRCDARAVAPRTTQSPGIGLRCCD